MKRVAAFIIMLLTMLVIVPVTAGASDDNTYYIRNDTSGLTHAIKPGTYIVRGQNGKFGSLMVYTGNNIDGHIKYNITLDGCNDIIELKDGDNAVIHGVELWPLESKELNACGSGTYIVGVHLRPGRYVVETNNSEVGTFMVYIDRNKSGKVDSYDIKGDTPYVIELDSGMMITLNGCKLIAR